MDRLPVMIGVALVIGITVLSPDRKGEEIYDILVALFIFGVLSLIMQLCGIGLVHMLVMKGTPYLLVWLAVTTIAALIYSLWKIHVLILFASFIKNNWWQVVLAFRMEPQEMWLQSVNSE